MKNICIKCGVDLVKREGAKFICKDNDCRGIVLSNETLKEFANKEETQGYICPHTKKKCDDECCVSAEDCHIEASIGILYDCDTPKQEHEEAAENYSRIILNKGGLMSDTQVSSFIAGAKWQQEKSYIEEEILTILHHRDYHMNNYDKLHGGFQTPKEWFNKFKKQ